MGKKSNTDSENKKARKAYKKKLRGKPSRSNVNETVGQTILTVFKQFIKVLVIIVLVISLTAGGVGAGMMFGYFSTAQPLNLGQLRSKSETSFIYDSEGNEIARLTGSQNIDREFITYDNFSDTYIEKAFIAIEDERFDSHFGIDFRRIGGAVLSFIVTAGNPTSGGSTITQQTIKMISGDDQRSAQRKIQEWYNAVRLERQLSKWEIMELYVNLVPMANSYVGIQSASRAYFDKDASELTLAECAFLAGIPNLPGIYNPLTESGRRNAFRRQRIVLAKMLELEFITEQEYYEALEYEIRFVTKAQTEYNIQINSYFVDYTIDRVRRDLMTERGYSSNLALTTIYNYGLKIYTTMEPSVQNAIDKAFNDESLFVTNPSLIEDFPERPQAGMVVINPSNSKIVGMSGGFGEKEANFVLNRATAIQRQPGSAVKPISVYGPAIDLELISGATIVKDEEMFLDHHNPNKEYPINFNKRHIGDVTIRNALKVSTNTIAAKVWMDLGPVNSLEYLRNTGIDRTDEQYVSIALGGFNRGISPLDIVYAYQPFANNGQYAPPICYEKVTDTDGNIILERRPTYYQVYRPESAAIMTDLLKEPMRGVYNEFPYRGTASGRTIRNSEGKEIPTAGKTGTSDNTRDVWFVGYTPYYMGSVWYGYDGRLKTINIPDPDSRNALNIWHQVMTEIHSDLEPIGFYYPPTLEEREICLKTGMLATEFCKEEGDFIVKEYFIPGSDTIPSEFCDVHLPETETDPSPTITLTPTPSPTPTPMPSPTPVPTDSPAPESTPPDSTPDPTPEPTDGTPDETVSVDES